MWVKFMRCARSNGGIVEFNKTAAELINRYRQLNKNDAEAGGMLLGRLISESRDLVVDEVTEPTKLDLKGRFSTVRLNIFALSLSDSETVSKRR